LQFNNTTWAASSITSLGGGLYRVNVTTNIATVSGTNPTVGILRQTTHSGKGFTISGYQLESGTAMTAYQAVTGNFVGSAFSITVDEPVDIAASTTYAIRVRGNDGSTKLTNVSAAVGNGINSLILVTPQAGINPGDLFLFGLAGQESIDMIVMKIEPGNDLSGKITAVDASPAVLTADSGTPPTFISSITGAPWNDPPPPPDLVIIASGEANVPPDGGGINDPGIVVGVGRGPSHIIRPPRRAPFLMQ
jgi:hypothetical protein